MTRATTSAKDSRPHLAAPTATTHTSRPVTGDSSQSSAAITATLLAELGGGVAHELVADIVRGVLDESRHASQDRTVESTMLEARRRLERFIRARTAE